MPREADVDTGKLPDPDYEVTGNIRHHRRDKCSGPPCPFHSPSLHPMIEEPMHLRTDWGVPLIERTCIHGVGHPDPDSVAFLEAQGLEGFDIHGCDGCCTKGLPK